MKITRTISFILFLIAAGCTPRQSEEVKDLKEEISDFNTVMVDDARKSWEETKIVAIQYREHLDEKIKLLEYEIAESADAAKVQLEKRRDELKSERQKLSQRIDKLGDDITEDWKDFVRETKEYFKKLENTIDS